VSVSEQYILSARAVRAHIHRAGVSLRPKTMFSRVRATELVRLYTEGWIGAELAAEFACSERTVFLELKRAGAVTRPGGRRRRV
jgi:hypothetical protein